MSHSHRRVAGLAAGCSMLASTLFAPMAAHGTIVSFDMLGSVVTRSAPPSNPALDLPPEIVIGADVAARIRYETVAVDGDASPGRGVYNLVIREFMVLAGGAEFIFQPQLPGASNFAVVRNDYLPPGSAVVADSFALIGLNGWPPYFPPGATFQLSLVAQDTADTAFNDALPVDMRVFDNWLVFWAIFNGPTLHSSATAAIRELRPTEEVAVPEPGTLGLMLLGLLGCAGASVPGLRVRVRERMARDDSRKRTRTRKPGTAVPDA
jgi:hypothetical protein